MSSQKTGSMAEFAALAPGDLRLLDSPVAERLLSSRELARIAYVAGDGTPRVLPMLFHWTGEEVVLSTFGGGKVSAMRARPDVAISIDAASTPPNALFVRGRAQLADVDGLVPEYRLAQVRYAGEQQAAANLAAVDHPGARMVRIAVRPAWVDVLDFEYRFPGGISGDDFARRGES